MAGIGREAIKWLASLGSGTLTAICVGLLIELAHLDVTTVLGGAIATAVGTAAVKFVGWATSKYGPAPPLPPDAGPLDRREPIP